MALRSFAFLTELFLAGLVAFLFHSSYQKISGDTISLEIDARIEQDDRFQLFYTDSTAYTQERSVTVSVLGNDTYQKIKLPLPKDSILSRFRLDPGNKSGKVFIRSIKLTSAFSEYAWYPDSILNNFIPNENIVLTKNEEVLIVNRHGNDPIMFMDKNIKSFYIEMMRTSVFVNKIGSILLSLSVFVLIFICLRLTKSVFKTVERLNEPNYSLVLFFVLLISLPLLNLIFPLIPEFEDREKREKQPKPIYNFNTITNYPKEFTAYFNDQFGFRSLLTKLNSYYKTRLLHSSPLPDKVILGKDNWLFLSDNLDLNLSPVPLLKKEEVEEIYTVLEQRTLNLKSKGIDYYVLIIPDKSVIYPEYLPDAYKKRNVNARMDQLMDKLKTSHHIKIMDPRKNLLEAKNKCDLYYSADTHWNIYAGMSIYNDLIKMIQRDHPEITTRPFSDFSFRLEERSEGDLGDLLNAPELYNKKVWLPVLQREKKLYDMKELKVKYKEVFTHLNNSNPRGKNILFYHDSFGLFFIKRIEEDFHTSSFYWKPEYSYKDVEEFKPDIIVHEVVTRFVTDLKN